MKKLIVLFSAIILMGCNEHKTVLDDGDYFIKVRITDPNIVIIDGCEYIQYKTYGYHAITHKGNCNNPIHY